MSRLTALAGLAALIAGITCFRASDGRPLGVLSALSWVTTHQLALAIVVVAWPLLPEAVRARRLLAAGLFALHLLSVHVLSPTVRALALEATGLSEVARLGKEPAAWRPLDFIVYSSFPAEGDVRAEVERRILLALPVLVALLPIVGRRRPSTTLAVVTSACVLVTPTAIYEWWLAATLGLAVLVAGLSRETREPPLRSLPGVALPLAAFATCWLLAGRPGQVLMFADRRWEAVLGLFR